MRILSRKIWRAFPELDQFDDETCQRYMNRLTKVHESKYGCMLLVFILVASFTAWVFIEYNALVLLGMLLDARGIKLGMYSEIFVILVAYSGYIWFPWVSILLLRDRWLYRGIRKQLKGGAVQRMRVFTFGIKSSCR